MSHQGACTEIDFKAEEWRWKLSKDNEWLKIAEEVEEKWHKKNENNHEHCMIKTIKHMLMQK